MVLTVNEEQIRRQQRPIKQLLFVIVFKHNDAYDTNWMLDITAIYNISYLQYWLWYSSTNWLCLHASFNTIASQSRQIEVRTVIYQRRDEKKSWYVTSVGFRFDIV